MRLEQMREVERGVLRRRFVCHFSDGRDITVSAQNIDAAERKAVKLASAGARLRCTLELEAARGLRRLSR